MSKDHPPASAPSRVLTYAELPRVALEFSSLPVALPLLASAPAGDDHTILVMPGFTAGDTSTAVLRTFLRSLGYRAKPWELGINTGQPALIDRLDSRFLGISDKAKAPISLVGQSLGGVFARELARRYPDRVRQVVSLGSPFGIRHRHTASVAVRRLFRYLSGNSVQQARARYADQHIGHAPDVPCTAIYSKTDGIVGWPSCLEMRAEHTENIEVFSSHCGMSVHPAVLYAVAERMQYSEANWQPFRPSHRHLSLLYPRPRYADDHAHEQSETPAAVTAIAKTATA